MAWQLSNLITTLHSLFIIGNDILHQLTAYHNQKLKIVLSDFDGITKHADYDKFYVGDEVSGYLLLIGGYSGDAGLYVLKTYKGQTAHESLVLIEETSF